MVWHPQSSLCKSEKSFPAGTVFYTLGGFSSLDSLRLTNTFSSADFLMKNNAQMNSCNRSESFRTGIVAPLYFDPKYFKDVTILDVVKI